MRILAQTATLSLATLFFCQALQAQETPPSLPATQEQEQEPKKELTEEERAQLEEQHAQIALEGLREEAKISLERLSATWAALKTAGKQQQDATAAEGALTQSMVDSLQNLVREQAHHLMAIVESLEEENEILAMERDLLFSVLGEPGRKPKLEKALSELEAEAEAMEAADLRKRMAVQFSLYKASISRVNAADAALAGAEKSEQEAATDVLNSAEVDSDWMAERLQVYINALTAKGGEGSGIVAIELYLTEQQGISLDRMGSGVLLTLAYEWGAIAWDWLIVNGPSFVFAVLKFIFIIFVFRLLAGVCSKLISRTLLSSKVNLSALLGEFAVKSTRNLIMIIGLLVAISSAGVNMAPLLAMIAATGLVIGLALQGTLSNFASGLMLLIYRPFDVEDVVVLEGNTGIVKNMTLVSTTLLTLDNKLLVIPNNSIWGNTITNVTARKKRRVDLVFGIGYADDILFVEKILHEVVTSHDKVLKDPELIIKVANLGDSSVDFIVRPWCMTDDYWNVYWDLTRSIKLRFDQEGISIPFPQRDVHMIQPPVEAEKKPFAIETSVVIPAVPPKLKGSSGITADAESQANVGEAESGS